MENQSLAKILEDLKSAGLIYNDADFCRKTGIKPSHISEIKTGKKPLTGYMMKRIEEAFPDFFNVGEDKEYGQGADISRLVDVIVAQNDTIKAMAATKDEQIASLLSIVEAMTGAEKKAAAS